MDRKKKRILAIVGLILLALCVAAGVYFGTCLHAGPEAQAALVSGNGVTVEAAPFGYVFDGPGSADAFVFYPGAMSGFRAYTGSKNKWCNFAFDTTDAPARLIKLSVAAKLPKERATLSFISVDLRDSRVKPENDKGKLQTSSIRITSDEFRLPNYMS